jgi:tetratricopeptide (TPR) repeat protein
VKSQYRKKWPMIFLTAFLTVSSAKAMAQSKDTLHTTGDQSPAVRTESGNINIVYNKGLSKSQKETLFKELNNNQKVIERLLAELDEKEIAVEDRQSKIDDWVKKYRELEKRLEQKEGQNKIVAKAKKKLNDGDLEGAETLLVQSYESHLEQIEKERKSAASDAFDLAGIKSLKLDYQGAFEYYKKAVEMDPDNSRYLNNFGHQLTIMGDLQTARPYCEKALEIRKKVLGEEHPDTAESFNNIGYLLQAMGDLQAARPYCEKALEIRKKVLGEEHPDTAESLNNIGYLLQAMGDLQAARPYYEKALGILTKSLGKEHLTTMTVQSNFDNLIGLTQTLAPAGDKKRFNNSLTDHPK